ncbi:hypothetical protein FWH58_02600 [Candidatus Saccharibacteria bacterium]|nr:hypothetical protein [Candidatus Saccharibacteria bacterium]
MAEKAGFDPLVVQCLNEYLEGASEQDVDLGQSIADESCAQLLEILAIVSYFRSGKTGDMMGRKITDSLDADFMIMLESEQARNNYYESMKNFMDIEQACDQIQGWLDEVDKHNSNTQGQEEEEYQEAVKTAHHYAEVFRAYVDIQATFFGLELQTFIASHLPSGVELDLVVWLALNESALFGNDSKKRLELFRRMRELLTNGAETKEAATLLYKQMDHLVTLYDTAIAQTDKIINRELQPIQQDL